DNAALYDYSENRQINDRKAAAGVELYRATNGEDPIYAAWAKTAIPDMFNCMGYSFIGPLAGFEVWRQGLGSPSALIDNLDFIEGKVGSSGLFNGIYQNSGWGTARDAGTAAFEYALAYVTTGSANTREQYIQRVEDHIAWVSGNNPRNQSFIVGYEGGPSDIHYRSPGTPNGALVSGPNGDGDWADDGSPKFCEVAIDYNAGIIGAVAFMKALSASDAVRVTEAFSASPTADADLNDEGVTFSATFSSSVEWSIDINGSFGSKTLSGSGSSINKVWDGTADEGFFLSDELVSARLSIDGEIAIIDLVNISPISITIGSAKKPGANPDDVLFDDFEDGDEINEFDGVWEPIGTITSGLYRTMISTRAEDGSEVIQARGSCSESGPDAYMGVRATFNSEGTPVDLGNPTSILFDLKANTSTNIAVELEQPNVTDGAYHRVIIPVTEGMNTYRLDISDFAQPDWKTLDIDLDLNNMSALRFTVYDSIGAAYLYLDNVYIENISLGIASPFTNNAITSFKPVFTNSNLVYTMPQLASETLNLSVYNLAGKQVLNKVLTAQRGKRTTVSLSQLPHGVYTVVHSSEGKMIGDKMMITHVK
ncbi:MAG: glycoside hydrolase family 9 protein, partial [Chitinispirillaceae bacterium]